MLIKELALYLQAQGCGTVATTLFIGSEPDKPDAVITLYDTGGFPPHATLDDVERTFQLRFRARTYDVASGRAWEAFTVLDCPGDRVITTPGDVRVRCRALQPPTRLGRDEAGRTIFVFNLACTAGRD